MTFANKIAFFLVSFTTSLVTVAYGGVHQPILALFYLLVAAMAIFFFVDALQTGALTIDRNLLQLPLYAVVIYGFIQVIPFGSRLDSSGLASIPRTISADPFSTLVNTLHFLALAVFFSVTLTSLHSVSRIKKTIAVIIIFGFTFSFFAILQSVLSPTRIYGIYEVRFATPFGSFVNRHNFAALVEMCLCIPLGMLFNGSIERDRRLLFITAASLMGIALVLSGSRGGFVAMLAGLIVIVVLTKRSESRRDVYLKTGLAAALVVLIVGGAVFVGGDSSLTRFVETAESKDISTNRFYIWSVTAKVIGANMPFGAGLGAFGVAFTPFDSNSGLERVEQAHNDYLQVLSDAGLAGLVIGGIFLFLFFSTGLKAVKAENQYQRGIAIGAFGGCCAVLVHSLFDFVLHTTAISLLFLITLGLVVAAGREYPDGDGKNRTRRRGRAGKVARFDGNKYLPSDA